MIPTTTDPACRCCTRPARGKFAAARVCQICTLCSGKHGAELYRSVIGHLNTGAIAPNHALAMIALDDAWLTDNAVINEAGTFVVTRTPRRWEVILAHSRVAGTAPELELVMQAALAPYMGKNAAPGLIEEAKAEVKRALITFDPRMFDVEVVAKPHPEHGVLFELTGKMAVNPEVLHEQADATAIPDDIMARPRGQA